MDPVVINRPEVNCETPVISENKHELYQVSANDSGEGLPYAPEDWPNPGDKWRWKVGRRVANGYFRDRYLYLPRHLPSCAHNGRKMRRFCSMLSFEEYVHSVFPGADVNALRNSFSWKIPSKELSNNLGCEEDPVVSGTNVVCKAGNKTCCSIVEAEDTHPKFMSCNICCSERGFCKYCCCILCSKTVDFACFGYDYIRCEAKVDGGLICGHIAHVNCSLRAYMAGTVGGINDSLQLDAEYYCRRCDTRTDLVPHVSKLLDTCKTIDSKDDIEKILAVGIRLLHKSRKENAQLLLQHIYLAIAKLKGGVKLEDNAMFNLRQSQLHEYKLVVEKLLAQKNIIQSLCDQLAKERFELARHASCIETETLLDTFLERMEKIEFEVTKFKEMKEVAENHFVFGVN